MSLPELCYVSGFPCNTYSHTRCAPALIIATQLCAAIGTLLASVFPISPNTKYLHLIPATIMTVSALGMCLTNESPRWLLLFGQRVEHAKASLKQLQSQLQLQGYSDPDIIICQATEWFQKDEEQFCARNVNIAVVRTYLRALSLAACLLSLPSMSGVHVYDFYSKWAFKFAGVFITDRNISLSVLRDSMRVAAVTIALGVLFVANGARSQCVSLIISTGTISIALGATGMFLFSLEQGENWKWSVLWLPLVIHIVFQTVFWFGVGSQTFITAYQFTPTPLRPSIISLAGGLHWLLEITVNKFLFFMIDTIHPFGTYWFYCGTSATGLVLIVFMIVPEISMNRATINVARSQVKCEMETGKQACSSPQYK
ncbi:putative polyol transporter 6 [Zootermopsis nevadensis]|uniref:Putative polyol transporter 6 n=1 Tax=Zootermopsis nevadensis TaxID=136037 RepID=A0A067R6E5_ZOONE|nr:putative polyol transporter 6 [Zootermopsis nevadensis]